MNVSSLSSASLRSLVALVESREKLQNLLTEIDAKIASVLGDGANSWKVPGSKAKAKPAPKPKKAKNTGRRGSLKEKLVPEFEAAGKTGVAVKDLAQKLGVKPQNIHVWIATTGKKLGVKKVSPGHYTL